MKRLIKVLSVAIIFILVLGIFSVPIFSNSNTVHAQDESPTQLIEPPVVETPTPTPTREPEATPTEETTFTPTSEPTLVPTEEISFETTSIPEELTLIKPGFNWSVRINGKAQGPSSKAIETLNSLKNQGIIGDYSSNKLNLSGSRDIKEMKQTIFEGLPEGFDLLGGPISLQITYQAEAGKEVVVRLESRPTTGYSWVLLPSSEFDFTQSGVSEFQVRSKGLGAPSIQTMRFTPNFSGTGTLHLAYQRSFEPDQPIETQLQLTLADQPAELDLSDPIPVVVDDEPSNFVGEEPSKEFSANLVTSGTLPSSFDWRTYGVVPSVRNQGGCGSCWAFGTVGIMESAIKIGGGALVDLSEQFLISCNNDGWSCSGGLTATKYHFNTLGKNQTTIGAVLESDKPYIATNGSCSIISNHPYKAADWTFVSGYESMIPTVDEIKSAIYTHGPVTARVCTGSGWSSYKGGVYATDEPYGTCSGSVNHQIILVGWDDSNQTWILRNSWGSSWGDGGYMHIRWNTSRVGEGTSWVKYGDSNIAPVAPALVVPATGTLTNERIKTLTWSTVPHASKFDVQVDNNSDFSSPESIGISHTTTSFTTTSLADGTYFWRVRAKNLLDHASPWSALRSFTIDATPPVPPVLSKPLKGSQSIGTPTFSWLASATAVRYQLQYETNNDGNPETNLFRSQELTTLTYKPGTTPALGVPLYWSVRAKDSLGNWSAWSAPFTVTIVPPVPPASVLIIPVSGLVTNIPAPTLTWKTVAYANTYEIQIDTTSTFLAPLVQEVVGITGLSHAYDPLPDGKYYWRVRARNLNNVAGAWSGYRYFTVDTTPPAPPVLTKPLNTSQSVGTPTFTWKASSSAKYYQVQYDNINDGTNTYDYLSPTSLTSLTHKPTTTLPLNVPTYWQVRAGDAAGNWSAWSSPFTVTVVPPVPLKPVLTTPSSGLVTNNSAPTLAWSTVAYADTYDIQIDNTSSFPAPLVKEYVGITGLSHVIDLLPDGKYYWRVRARNVNNTAGSWSSYRYFTIDTKGPNAPVLYKPAHNAAGIRTTPTFSWLASATANAYQFQYDNESTFTDPVSFSSPVLTVRTYKPGLTMSVGTWFWRVRARDAVGNWGPWSSYRTMEILPPL